MISSNYHHYPTFQEVLVVIKNSLIKISQRRPHKGRRLINTNEVFSNTPLKLFELSNKEVVELIEDLNNTFGIRIFITPDTFQHYEIMSLIDLVQKSVLDQDNSGVN
jgi:hypothetical protein